MITTPATLLRRASQYYADRTAVRYDGKELTFAQAWLRGLRLASALLAHGLQPQDRVATLEDNRIGAIDAYLATVAANLVRVPLYPRNAMEAHVHMLELTEAKVLLVDEEMATPEILALRGSVPGLREVIVRGKGYDTWLGGFEPLAQMEPGTGDDLHVIRFSGGTTGLPKGIPLTNRVWLSQLRDLTYVMPPIQPGDVCLHLGTLSHGSGYLFIPTWAAGGVNQLAVGFDPEQAIEIMDAGGASFAFLAPSQLSALVRAGNANGRGFPKLKALWIAGAPISPETALLSRDVFGERVYQTFNQTEVSLGVVMPPHEWFADIPGSKPLEAAGRVGPWAELEIRGENNSPLSTGEVGEIALRADGQMSGYLGTPELTAGKVVDGWVLTGDVGYLDRNGFLYIVDRKGAMIISGGYNIYPAELERVIEAIPGILETAVVPIPDPRWGETPLAVCVVGENSGVTEELIIETCRTRLGSYKKPGRVLLQRERLPMTPIGKVDRRGIKEPYWAGHAKRVSGT